MTVCALAVAVILVASCSRGKPQDQSSQAHRKMIGMTCMDLSNPFFKLIAEVMRTEANKYGYELVALSGDLDPAKQNNQVYDFIVQGYDAIFLNPVDSRAAAEGVRRARDAGIPVFTFDVQVTNDEVQDAIVSHIGSDNYQGGRLAAESMMKATNDSGQIAIVTFPEINSCILRRNGFVDYLKEHDSKLEIVTELSGKANQNDGYRVTTDMLQAHPNLVGIFAVNDPSALGAQAAVNKAAKQEQITIIGFDASPAGKQAVFERKLFDSPQQFPRKMAVGTVEAFVKYLDGEEVPKKQFIACAHYYYEDSLQDENRLKEQW
jgi:ribose transport system substrate-binding protein